MRPTRRQALGAAVALSAAPSLKANTAAKKVLVVVGPTNHPPGTHEIAASGRLLAHCVNAVPGLAAEIVTEWPGEAPKDVATVVFVGDMFPPEMMPHRDRAMNDLGTMMDAGCGIVCVHYSTGLEAKHVSETGDHPLLKWMGGYFATRCTHHKSVAKVFTKVTVEPGGGDHPISRGWKPFTFHDEPYYQNWFGKDGPAKTVTAIATAMIPPEKPLKETIGWAISRQDGGRGVGVVMPHFYRNWKLDDLRTLIMNSIAWSAKAEVPKEGVKVALPELTTFKPASVEPVVRKK